MKQSIIIVQILFVFSFIVTNQLFSSVSSLSAGSQQDTMAKQNSTKQPVYTTSRLVTAKPTYPTELNIQYDDKNIFISFRAFDGEPDKILRLAGAHDEFVGDVNVREIPSLTREEPGEEIWALMQKSAFQAILLLI
jgi:hypothetical protein